MPIEAKQEVSLDNPINENESQYPSIAERILRGVDYGLDFYGKNVKEVFYAEMEATQGLTRPEIVDNPERFEKSLSLFFTTGASMVDRSIGRGILREFDLPLSAGLNFRTAIEIVKRHPYREAL